MGRGPEPVFRPGVVRCPSARELVLVRPFPAGTPGVGMAQAHDAALPPSIDDPRAEHGAHARGELMASARSGCTVLMTLLIRWSRQDHQAARGNGTPLQHQAVHEQARFSVMFV